MKRVVVGVDRSVQAYAALRWAYEEAAAHRVELVVVTALDPMPTVGRMSAVEWSLVLDRRVEATMLWQRDLVAEVARDANRHPVNAVDTRVLEGHPVQVLVTMAEDADLLVVGDRGAGGLSKLLLGSVSTGVAHHARCPVVIVRSAPVHAATGDDLKERSFVTV